MNLAELTAKAMELRDRFDAAADAAGRPRWSRLDLLAGFVGDVGDLTKLAMAREGLREIPEADRKLGHELADCLWSILLLAKEHDVNLEMEFTKMLAKVTEEFDSPTTPPA